MLSRNVLVTQQIAVTVDETKFTPEFMAEFRESMYPFKSIDQHIEHLGQLYARGIYDEDSFIEGYGPARDFGIKFKKVEGYQEIVQ